MIPFVTDNNEVEYVTKNNAVVYAVFMNYAYNRERGMTPSDFVTIGFASQYVVGELEAEYQARLH